MEQLAGRGHSDLSLPGVGLLGSELPLALLWWNRATGAVRNGGCLLEGEPPTERARQRRDCLHLRAVAHLDTASIWREGKVWASH